MLENVKVAAKEVTDDIVSQMSASVKSQYQALLDSVSEDDDLGDDA